MDLREIRQSTASAYKNRLAVWAYPVIGDVLWNLLTREQIGNVLLRSREAKKSVAALEQIRCPLTRFYQWQMNVHAYHGPNPAGDLRFFNGRRAQGARAGGISSGSPRRRRRRCWRPAAS